MLKKLSLSICALVAAVGLAVAGGAFQGFPLVGGDGASNCLSFGNNGVCNQFQPAGPATLTGNETVAADTNIQGTGINTVAIDITSLGAGPYLYNAPLTGASITLTAQTRRLVLEPAGTIAALTVVWPAAAGLVDNQLMGICSRQVVTALTTTNGTGATVLDAPTALTAPLTTGAASCVEWVYRIANTSWYRVQ